MTRSARGLVGRDLARAQLLDPPARRVLMPLLLGLLLAGLFLTALRVDLQRLGYALAAAEREKSELLDERNGLTARVRAQRHPTRLAELAHERGFARPGRVIDLAARGAPAADPRP